MLAPIAVSVGEVDAGAVRPPFLAIAARNTGVESVLVSSSELPDIATDRESVEVPLLGGRITPGVVRVGDTVRRPQGPHSAFVHALLTHLERVRFDAAPRFLGIDRQGREILSYIDGFVPDDIEADMPDEQLATAAQVLRRFHDATAESELAGGQEVVCHNDISPVNTVFVDGRPTALIDFDMARPGPRIRDVSYGLFLWLNLGWDGPGPEEQRRRIRLWCDAYGLFDRDGLIAEVRARVRETIERRRRDGAGAAGEWWHAQLAWIDQHRHTIAP